jgi:hypothetical protein
LLILKVVMCEGIVQLACVSDAAAAQRQLQIHEADLQVLLHSVRLAAQGLLLLLLRLLQADNVLLKLEMSGSSPAAGTQTGTSAVVSGTDCSWPAAAAIAVCLAGRQRAAQAGDVRQQLNSRHANRHICCCVWD